MGDAIQAGDQLLLKYGLENPPLGVNGPSYFAAAKKFATAVEVVCAPDRDAAADKVVAAAKAVVKTADAHFYTVFRNTHHAQGARSVKISQRLATLKQARAELIQAKNLLQETLKNQTDLKAIATARNKVKQAEVNFVILLRSGSSALNHARADLIEARSNLETTVELKKNPQAAFMDSLTELCNLLPTLSEKVEETGAIQAIVGYAKNLTFLMPFGLALAIPLVAAPVLGVATRSCFFTRNVIYATECV